MRPTSRASDPKVDPLLGSAPMLLLLAGASLRAKNRIHLSARCARRAKLGRCLIPTTRTARQKRLPTRRFAMPSRRETSPSRGKPRCSRRFSGILLVLAFAARSTTKALTEKLSLFVNRPEDFRLESGADAAALIHAVALEVGQFLIPTIAILAGCSLAASILQNVPSIVSERIRPQWNRISPMRRLEADLRPSGFGGIFKVVVQVRNDDSRQSSAPESRSNTRS